MARPPELQACAPQLCACAGTPGLPLLLFCRATLTPFIANDSMGLDTFKWLLFGDDGEQAVLSDENTPQWSKLQSMQHIAPTLQGLPPFHAAPSGIVCGYPVRREAEAPASLAADTIFFVENTLNMLETMDHTVPYILSDHIW